MNQVQLLKFLKTEIENIMLDVCCGVPNRQRNYTEDKALQMSTVILNPEQEPIK